MTIVFHRLLVAIGCLCAFQSIAFASHPLKVFILAGQSNMEGHAHVRTLEHLAMQEATRPMLESIQGADGVPILHQHVWISYLSAKGVKQGRLTTGYGADDQKIGPELTFGIALQQALQEPILIIKTAWGGKSLHTDFRPPSAGPFVFSDAQLEQLRRQGKNIDHTQAEKAAATGHFYRLMVDHVREVLADIRQVYPEYDEKAGYKLSGFVWFQGWNDMVDGGVYPDRDKPNGYRDYSVNLSHFIRDVRRDLQAPNLPFVIGVMGVGGPTGDYAPQQQRYRAVHQNFRDAMAAPSKLPEFEDTVVAVLTEQCWDRELGDLRARQAEVRQQAKQQAKKDQLDPQAARQLEAAMEEKAFTARERQVLEKGISNAEYHYLGSARILGVIGQHFAEAMKEQIRTE